MTASGPSEGAEMRSTAKLLADVVGVGPHVKSLAAHHAEIDFRQGDAGDLKIVNTHKPRLPFDLLSLARQFVERHTILLDGAYHGGELIKISLERFERGLDLISSEIRDRLGFEDLAFLVLGGGGAPQRQSSGVFFVLGHEEVLNARGIAEHENEHSCRHGIKCAAMSDLLLVEASTGHSHDVMRRHVGFFVDEEDSTNLFF